MEEGWGTMKEEANLRGCPSPGEEEGVLSQAQAVEWVGGLDISGYLGSAIDVDSGGGRRGDSSVTMTPITMETKKQTDPLMPSSCPRVISGLSTRNTIT